MTTKIKSNRAPLESPPFSNIPDHWEPLIGYEFRVVNKDGTSALDKTGKPKIGRIDLYDLMILDAMRSYKEQSRSGPQKCFIEAEQLSIKIGMRGQPLKKVCNRVLQLMHIGFIRCTPEIYGPTDAVRLVWEVDTKFMEDTARGIDAKRKDARLLAVKNGDFSTGSIGSITLKEYLKEYLKEQISEQSSEQLPKQAKKDSSEKITEQRTENLPKYKPEQSQEHKTAQIIEFEKEDFHEAKNDIADEDAVCTSKEDNYISSNSSIQEEPYVVVKCYTGRPNAYHERKIPVSQRYESVKGMLESLDSAQLEELSEYETKHGSLEKAYEKALHGDVESLENWYAATYRVWWEPPF